MDKKPIMNLEKKIQVKDFMLFNVIIPNKNGKIEQYIVKGESVGDVLEYTQKKLNAPVLGIYPTDYIDYLNTKESIPEEQKGDK